MTDNIQTRMDLNPGENTLKLAQERHILLLNISKINISPPINAISKWIEDFSEGHISYYNTKRGKESTKDLTFVDGLIYLRNTLLLHLSENHVTIEREIENFLIPLLVSVDEEELRKLANITRDFINRSL
jgi:hypothetical protein